METDFTVSFCIDFWPDKNKITKSTGSPTAKMHGRPPK